MGIGMRILSGEYHPDRMVKKHNVLILNEMSTSVEDRQKVNDQLLTELSGDLEIIPTCKCGYLTAPLSLGASDPCPACNEVVTDTINGPIEPTIFFKAPKGVRGLLQINLWMMMQNTFTKKPFNALLYLTDTNYSISNPQIIAQLEARGLKRGYNNFYNNIDNYLVHLCDIFKQKRNAKAILPLWRKNKANLRTNHIYFMNKILVIIEDTPTGKYMDENFNPMLDAVKGVISIDQRDLTLARRENMTARMMDKTAAFYTKYLGNTLNGKPGGLRMHLNATRGTRIARLVITSITEPHVYNEIHIPWVAGIHLFRQPITSIMFKRGYTLSEVTTFIQRSTQEWNPTMDAILTELLETSNNKLIATITQRFPTLKRGSMLLMYIAKIKRDVLDRSLGYPITAVRPPNADFDGDSLHVSAFIDRIMEEILEPLAYHHNALSNTQPRTLTDAIGLSVPVASNLATWHESADILVEDANRLQSLYDKYG